LTTDTLNRNDLMPLCMKRQPDQVSDCGTGPAKSGTD